MTAWEYTRIVGHPDHGTTLTEALTAHGADGWELISAFATGGRLEAYVFKRPVQSGDGPADG